MVKNISDNKLNKVSNEDKSNEDYKVREGQEDSSIVDDTPANSGVKYPENEKTDNQQKNQSEFIDPEGSEEVK